MSVGVQGFVGGRLKEARLSCGHSKRALAESIGVSGTAISRYEGGLDNPHEENFELILCKLPFPRGFYFRSVWDEQLDTIFWRSRNAETKRARTMTEQRMRWACELFAALEEDLEFPPVAIPSFNLSDGSEAISDELIEEVANELRSKWRLGDQPIPDMILALENAGIVVLALEVASEKQDGFCFKSRNLDRFFVGINTLNASCSRLRYDAAHELGHIVLHRDLPASQVTEPAYLKQIEHQAHRFAAAFLFPRNAFRREIQSLSLDYLSNIKRRWGMSVAAMIYRACDLGLIDAEEKADLYRKMTRRKWRGALQEPYDNLRVMPLEKPRMVRRGIEALASDNLFGFSQLERSLAFPFGEIERFAGVQADYFQKEVPNNVIRLRHNDKLRTIDLVSGNIIEFSQRKPKL